MTIEAGLYAHLCADSSVAALVSTRIYPLLVPQDATLPALAYQRISGPRDHAHTGATGLALARMQLTYVAASYEDTKSLAEAVRAAMDGLRGSMGAVQVGSCMLDNEQDDWATVFEKPVVRHDYLIWYQE
jgi:hypothetical protein